MLWQVHRSVTTVAKLMGSCSPCRIRDFSTRSGTPCRQCSTPCQRQQRDALPLRTCADECRVHRSGAHACCDWLHITTPRFPHSNILCSCPEQTAAGFTTFDPGPRLHERVHRHNEVGLVLRVRLGHEVPDHEAHDLLRRHVHQPRLRQRVAYPPQDGVLHLQVSTSRRHGEHLVRKLATASARPRNPSVQHHSSCHAAMFRRPCRFRQCWPPTASRMRCGAAP